MTHSHAPAALAFSTLALTVGLTACADREPGPSEDERGQVFFWEVVGAEIEFGDECTDDEEFRDDLNPLEFEENTYLIYRVGEDGKRAMAMDCDSLSGDTCSDDEQFVFEIDGSTLTYDQAGIHTNLETWACDLLVDGFWTLKDKGETMDFTLDITAELIEHEVATQVNDCAAAEADTKENSDNGMGIDGCVITHTIELEFSRTDDAPDGSGKIPALEDTDDYCCVQCADRVSPCGDTCSYEPTCEADEGEGCACDAAS